VVVGTVWAQLETTTALGEMCPNPSNPEQSEAISRAYQKEQDRKFKADLEQHLQAGRRLSKSGSLEPIVMLRPAIVSGGRIARLVEHLKIAFVETWDGTTWTRDPGLFPADVMEGYVLSSKNSSAAGIPAADLEDGDMEGFRKMLCEVGRESRVD